MNFTRTPLPHSLGKSCIAALFAGALVISTAASAQETDKVLATVDGENITEKDLDLAKVLIGDSMQQIPEEDRRKQLVALLVETYLLANAAESEGARETEAYKRRIKFLDLRALRDTYVDANVRSKITDEDVKARYNSEVIKLKPEVEVSARHILVPNEADAKAIIKELDGGADFAQLAKQKSTGPSGPNGGDLGFFGPGRMVPEFDAAVFKLEKGAHSKTPVKTQFGWHVIKLEERREKPVPPFEDVSEQILRVLASERYANIIKGLREKAKVKILDK